MKSRSAMMWIIALLVMIYIVIPISIQLIKG